MKMKKHHHTNRTSHGFLVAIDTDEKTSKNWENKYHTSFVHLMNEEYGIGVWFGENGSYGTYGANNTLIDSYWDRHVQEIEKGFSEANCFEDILNVGRHVIVGTILVIKGYAAA